LYASLGFSLLLGALVSFPIFVIIILFDALAYFYSAPPVKLRNRAYWDWIFVFLWKGLVIAASYVYFFGTDLSAFNPFMYGTLAIIMLLSLISQMDNQIRDFEVDRTTNSNHSVQRLGHRTSSFLKLGLLIFFYGFSIVFCYLFGLYLTIPLIAVNVLLYYPVNPRKYSLVLEFGNIWIVVLFLEHFMGVYSYQQQVLFSVWIVAMLAIAVIHVKRNNMFEDANWRLSPL
jgi:1,4-dihydroxy-2-naphthoate octaprenyltransferase